MTINGALGWGDNRGELHRNAELTDDQIREIRQAKLTRLEIAEKYKITPNYVGKILRNAVRKDVTK